MEGNKFEFCNGDMCKYSSTIGTYLDKLVHSGRSVQVPPSISSKLDLLQERRLHAVKFQRGTTKARK
ncbi:hypothetical protein LENED_000884 [Lentinula edodes]|uniref:Uncharacterized protein n=1 Tax=Lentinula edodes TaxID=5353 RepID=A0A1Q3DWQ0_LENED|nr:hypothetical protein LENED_000884 [Lentinula edodes]